LLLLLLLLLWLLLLSLLLLFLFLLLLLLLMWPASAPADIELMASLNEPLAAEEPADPRACGHCGKRISLTASVMPCHCKRVFCDDHRAGENHGCTTVGAPDASALAECSQEHLPFVF